LKECGKKGHTRGAGGVLEASLRGRSEGRARYWRRLRSRNGKNVGVGKEKPNYNAVGKKRCGKKGRGAVSGRLMEKDRRKGVARLHQGLSNLGRMTEIGCKRMVEGGTGGATCLKKSWKRGGVSTKSGMTRYKVLSSKKEKTTSTRLIQVGEGRSKC